MKNFLLIVLLFLFALPAFAQNAEAAPTTGQALTTEIAKMSDQQKADLLQNIQNPPKPVEETSTAKKAKEWVEVGEGLGSALAGTAGKLGVEVNKFAQTPVGQLATFLIVWHFIGDSVLDLITDILFPLIFVTIWGYNFRKMFGEFSAEGKFIRYNMSIPDEDGTKQTMLAVFTVAFFLILLISAIFFAA